MIALSSRTFDVRVFDPRPAQRRIVWFDEAVAEQVDNPMVGTWANSTLRSIEEEWVFTLIPGKAIRAEAPALREAYARLDRLAALPANWDEEGADAIRSEAIEAARAVIAEYAACGLEPEFVVPGKSGEVVIEYEGTLDRSAEVVVRSDFDKSLILFDGLTSSSKNRFSAIDVLAIREAPSKKAGHSWLRRLLSPGD